MESITVRDVEDHVMLRLQGRARRNGRSLEAEVRAIVVEAVGADEAPRTDEEAKNLLSTLHERFAELGGVDLDIPPRDHSPRIVEFD